MKFNHKIIRYRSIIVLTAAIGMLFSSSSCKKWTEQEPLTIQDPTIESTDPALYAKYLENLRAYKSSAHKEVFAWFDNSNKSAGSQGYQISQIPDSIDYVILKQPDQLQEREINAIDRLSNDKGTKALMEFDYDALKSAYVIMTENDPELAKTNPKMTTFETYLSDTLAAALALSTKYAYQGMVVGYRGKSIDFMNAEEKAAYTKAEQDFWNVILEWKKSNTNKALLFKGYPQFLLDKTILTKSQYIILPNDKILSAQGLTFQLLAAVVAGVPTDRFIVLAETSSLQASDKKTGYFSDGSRAITATASWAAGIQQGIQLAGIGVINISNDYFNPGNVYQYSKQAIRTLNPSVNQ